MPKVLIVDDSQEMLFALSEGLEKYKKDFEVVLAKDGVDATEKLKNNTISLVVTDLKMPNMDGFSLLVHIMKTYPGIPVVIITGYSTPQMEQFAREGGAIGYIEKPFMIEKLGEKILNTIQKQADGGSLQNVTSSMFLQLIEMEQKTCTVRLTERTRGKQGVLFFKDGQIMDARVAGISGEKAAYIILAWDEVNLSIQNECPIKKNMIKKDMQSLYLDALRIKDETEAEEKEKAEAKAKAKAKNSKPAQSQKTPPKEEVLPPPILEEDEEDDAPPVFVPVDMNSEIDPIEDIQLKLGKKLGSNRGILDVYRDSKWDEFMAKVKKIGQTIKAGNLQIAMVNSKALNSYVLVPDKETIVIALDAKAPKDRIAEILTK